MKNIAMSSSWASLPVIARVARLLCRELTLQNEYLRTENKILKSKVRGRIGFTDDNLLHVWPRDTKIIDFG